MKVKSKKLYIIMIIMTFLISFLMLRWTTSVPAFAETVAKADVSTEPVYTTTDLSIDSEKNNASLVIEAITEQVDSNVTLKTAFGTVSPSSVKLYYGEPFALPTPTEVAGREFLGWCLNSENGRSIAILGTQITDENGQSISTWNYQEDIILDAAWKTIGYRISYDLDGGSYPDGVTNPNWYMVDDTVTINNPIRGGYRFVGWMNDDTGVVSTTTTIPKGSTGNKTYTAQWAAIEYKYKVILNNQIENGGDSNNGTDSVQAAYGAPMPDADPPEWLGYTFQGYFAEPDGEGKQYYDAQMNSVNNWDIEGGRTIYADWEANTYTVFLDSDGYGGTEEINVTFGSDMPMENIIVPTRLGYRLVGYFDGKNGSGTKYYDGANMASSHVWDKTSGATLYADWERIEYTITYVYAGDDVVSNPTTYNVETPTFTLTQPADTPKTGYKYVWDTTQVTQGTTGNLVITALVKPIQYHIYFENMSSANIGIGYPGYFGQYCDYDVSYTLSREWIEPSEGWVFDSWVLTNKQTGTETKVGTGMTYTFKNLSSVEGDRFLIAARYKEEDDSCVAAGTLITLSDGRQVPVETLTGNEMLLVWNLHTGSFDVAPILFIDHDTAAMYKIINLQFSDGTQVKVIYEHAFWDFNLNKYVFLREDAAQYVGHWFNKQTTDSNGNMVWTRVQLTNVTITEEYTTAWSPVTYGHLCIYVNGMLSMPGATEGLINIFEVDSDTMQIDQEQYLADIATYGLFTYEEFSEIYPIPETIFEAFGGEYLKVSIGKGLIDYETLGQLIERYSEFFE